jgi:hypothetical protein
LFQGVKTLDISTWKPRYTKAHPGRDPQAFKDWGSDEKAQRYQVLMNMMDMLSHVGVRPSSWNEHQKEYKDAKESVYDPSLEDLYNDVRQKYITEMNKNLDPHVCAVHTAQQTAPGTPRRDPARKLFTTPPIKQARDISSTLRKDFGLLGVSDDDSTTIVAELATQENSLARACMYVANIRRVVVTYREICAQQVNLMNKLSKRRKTRGTTEALVTNASVALDNFLRWVACDHTETSIENMMISLAKHQKEVVNAHNIISPKKKKRLKELQKELERTTARKICPEGHVELTNAWCNPDMYQSNVSWEKALVDLRDSWHDEIYESFPVTFADVERMADAIRTTGSVTLDVLLTYVVDSTIARDAGDREIITELIGSKLPVVVFTQDDDDHKMSGRNCAFVDLTWTLSLDKTTGKAVGAITIEEHVRAVQAEQAETDNLSSAENVTPDLVGGRTRADATHRKVSELISFIWNILCQSAPATHERRRESFIHTGVRLASLTRAVREEFQELNKVSSVTIRALMLPPTRVRKAAENYKNVIPARSQPRQNNLNTVGVDGHFANSQQALILELMATLGEEGIKLNGDAKSKLYCGKMGLGNHHIRNFSITPNGLFVRAFSHNYTTSEYAMTIMGWLYTAEPDGTARYTSEDGREHVRITASGELFLNIVADKFTKIDAYYNYQDLRRVLDKLKQAGIVLEGKVVHVSVDGCEDLTITREVSQMNLFEIVEEYKLRGMIATMRAGGNTSMQAVERGWYPVNIRLAGKHLPTILPGDNQPPHREYKDPEIQEQKAMQLLDANKQLVTNWLTEGNFEIDGFPVHMHDTPCAESRKELANRDMRYNGITPASAVRCHGWGDAKKIDPYMQKHTQKMKRALTHMWRGSYLVAIIACTEEGCDLQACTNHRRLCAAGDGKSPTPVFDSIIAHFGGGVPVPVPKEGTPHFLNFCELLKEQMSGSEMPSPNEYQPRRHDMQLPYHCPFCIVQDENSNALPSSRFSFDSNAERKRHIMRYHPMEHKRGGGWSMRQKHFCYVCHTCQSAFTTLASLQHHYKTSTEGNCGVDAKRSYRYINRPAPSKVTKRGRRKNEKGDGKPLEIASGIFEWEGDDDSDDNPKPAVMANIEEVCREDEKAPWCLLYKADDSDGNPRCLVGLFKKVVWWTDQSKWVIQVHRLNYSDNTNKFQPGWEKSPTARNTNCEVKYSMKRPTGKGWGHLEDWIDITDVLCNTPVVMEVANATRTTASKRSIYKVYKLPESGDITFTKLKSTVILKTENKRNEDEGDECDDDEYSQEETGMTTVFGHNPQNQRRSLNPSESDTAPHPGFFYTVGELVNIHFPDTSAAVVGVVVETKICTNESCCVIRCRISCLHVNGPLYGTIVPLPDAKENKAFRTAKAVNPPTLKNALLLDIPCCLIRKLSTTEGTEESAGNMKTWTEKKYPFNISHTCLATHVALPDPELRPNVGKQLQTVVSETVHSITYAKTWIERNCYFDWRRNSCAIDAFAVTERAIAEVGATITCAKTKNSKVEALFSALKDVVARAGNPNKKNPARSKFWRTLADFAPGHVLPPGTFNSVFNIVGATYSLVHQRLLRYKTKVNGTKCDLHSIENGKVISIPAAFRILDGRTPTEQLLHVLSRAQHTQHHNFFHSCSHTVAGTTKEKVACKLCEDESCKEIFLLDAEQGVHLPRVLVFEFDDQIPLPPIEPDINIAGQVYHLISAVTRKNSSHFTSTATHHTP